MARTSLRARCVSPNQSRVADVIALFLDSGADSFGVWLALDPHPGSLQVDSHAHHARQVGHRLRYGARAVSACHPTDNHFQHFNPVESCESTDQEIGTFAFTE
jgi:hypothetical protein